MNEEPEPHGIDKDMFLEFLKNATVVDEKETEAQIAAGTPVLCIRVGEVTQDKLFPDNLIRQCKTCGHDVYLRPFFEKATVCICNHCIASLAEEIKGKLGDDYQLKIGAPISTCASTDKIASMEKLIPHLKEFVENMGQLNFSDCQMEVEFTCQAMLKDGKPDSAIGKAIDDLMSAIAAVHGISRDMNIIVLSSILAAEIIDEIADAKVVRSTANVDEEIAKLHKLMGGEEGQ